VGSRDLDVDVQALAYLVTVLIHRLHENDPIWWQEFRDEIKQARTASPVGSVKAKVLERAIGIVEESMKGHDGE
jgi:hypothetical protein